MNQNNNFNQIKSQSFKERFSDFLKQKLLLIILAIGCVIFTLKDAIQYGKTTDGIVVIGLNFIITYIFTLYTTTILGKMGMKTGLNSDKFISTMEYYSRAKQETEPIRSYLSKYCDYKNKLEVESVQSEILYQENLFLNKLQEYKKNDLNKKQWKAVKKALKVKVVKLCDKDLISERGKSLKTKYTTYLGKKQSSFETQNLLSNAVSKLILPFAISFLTVEAIIWSNLLSGAIKTLLIVLGGILNYFTNEEFAVNELRNRFINKADVLLDFKNLYETKPELLGVKEKRKQEE